MLETGELVLGRYRIDRLIGSGGMGLVYRAVDEESGMRVAVKLLRSTGDTSALDVRRFYREARVLSRVKHEHVLNILDVGELEPGVPVLAMELLEGRDLRAEQRVRDSFPVDEATGYLYQAARAVAAVHAAGIVHRDLKPQNLFLTNLLGARKLKLLDFGISKLSEDTEGTLTATAAVLGTPHYMSPEQILDSKDVDQRTDVWALGVTLYFVLSQQLPFAGSSAAAVIAAISTRTPTPIEQLRPELPRELAEIVACAMAKRPTARFASADELAEALRPFAALEIFAPAVQIPTTVPPVVGAPRLARRARPEQSQGGTLTAATVPRHAGQDTGPAPSAPPTVELEAARRGAPPSVPTRREEGAALGSAGQSVPFDVAARELPENPPPRFSPDTDPPLHPPPSRRAPRSSAPGGRRPGVLLVALAGATLLLGAWLALRTPDDPARAAGGPRSPGPSSTEGAPTPGVPPAAEGGAPTEPQALGAMPAPAGSTSSPTAPTTSARAPAPAAPRSPSSKSTAPQTSTPGPPTQKEPAKAAPLHL